MLNWPYGKTTMTTTTSERNHVDPRDIANLVLIMETADVVDAAARQASHDCTAGNGGDGNTDIDHDDR